MRWQDVAKGGSKGHRFNAYTGDDPTQIIVVTGFVSQRRMGVDVFKTAWP